MDETLDPTNGCAPPSAEPARAPVAEIAFHSDLRRIGDQAAFRDDEMLVGRETSFSGVALADPTVSRRQLTIQWDVTRGTFRVRGEPGSRREITLLDTRGRPLAGDEAPPGAFVAIGDRVLLLLAMRGEWGDDELGMIGRSDAIVSVRRRIRVLAASTETVLVRGDTGVGKELVALAIHTESPRAGGRFVPVNCGALPDALVESELFGHVRGAFSGAVPKDGLFRSAEGGTLFLDEIGELPLAAQAKLLRALEQRRVRPVGSENERGVDVRVVAATNRDLAAEVEAGRFRADLLSRLEGLEIHVPPLRERLEDVPLLFATFVRRNLAQPAWITPAWLRVADAQRPPVPMGFFLGLLGHPWARNVRELRKLAAAAATLGRASTTFVAPELQAANPAPRPASSLPTVDTKAAERPTEDEIVRVLEEHDYVQLRAARALGVSHSTLDRWRRELGLVRPTDIPRERIEQAVADAGGDEVAAAKALRISCRGLRLRRTELERSLRPGAAHAVSRR